MREPGDVGMGAWAPQRAPKGPRCRNPPTAAPPRRRRGPPPAALQAVLPPTLGLGFRV